MTKALKLIITFLIVSFPSLAQMPDNTNESAQILRQNGQIYLVVLVLVTIFAGIIFMLIRLEKKLSALEKNKN